MKAVKFTSTRGWLPVSTLCGQSINARQVKSGYLNHRGELAWITYVVPEHTLRSWTEIAVRRRMFKRWACEIQQRTVRTLREALSMYGGHGPPLMSPLRLNAADSLLAKIRLSIISLRVPKRKQFDWHHFVALVDAFNHAVAQAAIVIAGLTKARGDWTREEGFEP